MSNSKSIGYLATALGSGLLFGAGLYISQMVDPLKVLRFLDFGAIGSGGWDPSLAFVISPAILVTFLGFRLLGNRTSPLFDNHFYKPDLTQIDAKLILGAALFGIGWGMSGICPGPAISLIAFMPENLVLFLATMFAGSLLATPFLRLVNGAPAPA